MKSSVKLLLAGLAAVAAIHYAALQTNNLAAVVAASSVVGYLPFALLVFWVISSPRLGAVRAAAKTPSGAIVLSALFAVYWLYSHKWAGDQVNDLFGIDPRFFPTTTTVLAWLLAPFGWIVANDYVAVLMMLIGAALVMLLSGSLVAVMFVKDEATVMERVKGAVVLCILIGFMATYGLSVNYLMQAYRPTIKRFAVWADFNSKYRCYGTWSEGVDSVLFLDGSRVFAHYPKGEVEFRVVECQFYINQFRTD